MTISNTWLWWRAKLSWQNLIMCGFVSGLICQPRSCAWAYFPAPAGVPLDALLSWQVLSEPHAGPFVPDIVTLRLLLLARRSRSRCADRSKWKLCPTNRDKYTLPLLCFTLVFPTLLKPLCLSRANSEEMTDHIKRLVVALTGVFAPVSRRERDVLALIRELVSYLCVFWKCLHWQHSTLK